MSIEFRIEDKLIGSNHPTYFIADIAANHDGNLDKAIKLIRLAAEAGADAVKFQHFNAKGIVSDKGFKDLQNQKSHQAKWNKTVFEVYEDASLNRNWTTELQNAAKEYGVHFFSSPYDFEAVDLLNKAGAPAHKIGSGDITWTKMIEYISQSNKPVILATGASTIEDVERAMDTLNRFDVPKCLMQCNTNYTGDLENLKHIHLNVLSTYKLLYPNVVLGLSDHTPGHSTVLGAVALGARMVEKHFTDDKSQEGPDHKFSMDPRDWKEMVDRTRELEAALGSTRKFIAGNEQETVVLQRRCLRLKEELTKGAVLTENNLEVLRPAPADAIMPYDLNKILGKRLNKNKTAGEHLTFFDVE